MTKFYGVYGLLFGLAFLLSPLLSQSKLKDLQQIQLLSQDDCVIVQINADWNIAANIDLSDLRNCLVFNASIDNNEYGAVIADEWKVRSVPTIIMFEYGKEVKRFEAGLSFNLDEAKIKTGIKDEIDKIMIRRFQ